MATKGIALRKWSLSASDYENENEFRAAVQNELASFEHIGERLGIGLVSAPIRAQLPNGGWYTAGWVFQTATVPAASEGASLAEAPVPEVEQGSAEWAAEHGQFETAGEIAS